MSEFENSNVTTLHIKLSKGETESFNEYEHRRSLYEVAANKHNHAMNTSDCPNAGFDLFVPQKVTLSGFTNTEINRRCTMVKHNVSCSMTRSSGYLSYYMYPRSSISKTTAILANSVGIIDSGYRGDVMAALKFVDDGNDAYTIQPYERIVQICSPDLGRFYVHILAEGEELSSTERGDGGFGSTGK